MHNATTPRISRRKANALAPYLLRSGEEEALCESWDDDVEGTSHASRQAKRRYNHGTHNGVLIVRTIRIQTNFPLSATKQPTAQGMASVSENILSAVSDDTSEEPGAKAPRTGESQVTHLHERPSAGRTLPRGGTGRIPCISGRQVIVDELFTGREVIPLVPDRELLTKRTLTDGVPIRRFRTFPRGLEPHPWRGEWCNEVIDCEPEDGGGEVTRHPGPQGMEIEGHLTTQTRQDPRVAASQAAAPPQEHLPVAPQPTGLFPLSAAAVVASIEQAPVLHKASLLWVHLSEAGDKLQGQDGE
ncbi:hypothetical protein CYMTET_5313 [Cymbomonas tetramitiformis]|uniref:Uncharacterized protein n=1 Tax=Cymbomonas tetramitiformis TaxID=36881 RepID=A0AAE0H1B4_9CHLO|nr:hypothetical protein CYMTET_5313 [Cymbomonas tetramitiformis]